MGKILALRKSRVTKVDLESVSKIWSRGCSIKFALCLGWMIFRLPLFLLMYWLRLPITLICNLFAAPLLFAFLFCWYAFPIPKMLWGLGGLSFTAFAVLWFYDFILMALSPQEMVRSL